MADRTLALVDWETAAVGIRNHSHSYSAARACDAGRQEKHAVGVVRGNRWAANQMGEDRTHDLAEEGRRDAWEAEEIHVLACHSLVEAAQESVVQRADPIPGTALQSMAALPLEAVMSDSNLTEAGTVWAVLGLAFRGSHLEAASVQVSSSGSTCGTKTP